MQFLSLLAVLAAFAASATAAPTPEQGTEGNVHVAVAREVVKHHYTINLGQGVVTTADVSGSVGADLVAGAPAYHGFEFELGPTKERLSVSIRVTSFSLCAHCTSTLHATDFGHAAPRQASVECSS